MDIVEALDARTGMTCVVGAGGKKSTMATLACRLEEAVVTATVRIPIFDDWVSDVAVTGDPLSVVEACENWPVGVVPERDCSDRYLGYDTTTVDELQVCDRPVLVKADGARMRLFKAPSDDEPQIPSTADTVLPIASAHVVGSPLTADGVHRVEAVSRLTGRSPGETIRPSDVAAVLASERGGQKGVPDGATVIPVINMVDDTALEATARSIAEEIHERTDVPRVVLTEMRSDDPLVAVV